MRFVCDECGELVEERDVIIEFGEGVTYAYCYRCWHKLENK